MERTNIPPYAPTRPQLSKNPAEAGRARAGDTPPAGADKFEASRSLAPARRAREAVDGAPVAVPTAKRSSGRMRDDLNNRKLSERERERGPLVLLPFLMAATEITAYD